MKKILLSFIVLLTLAVVFSCNKDDDNDSNASIVGKWIFTRADFQFTVLGTPVDSTFTGDGSSYIEYKSDGTGTSVDSTGETDNFSYNYNSSTKVLTETSTDTTITYNVVKLTSSDLQLHTEGTSDYLGLPVAFKADLYFKK